MYQLVCAVALCLCRGEVAPPLFIKHSDDVALYTVFARNRVHFLRLRWCALLKKRPLSSPYRMIDGLGCERKISIILRHVTRPKWNSSLFFKSAFIWSTGCDARITRKKKGSTKFAASSVFKVHAVSLVTTAAVAAALANNCGTGTTIGRLVDCCLTLYIHSR